MTIPRAANEGNNVPTAKVITLIRVDLEITEPWAVGGVATVRDAIDLPVQADPRDGAPHVPSTSLVGALRSHLGRGDPDEAEKWLGPVPGPAEASTGDVPRVPSRLRALGTRVSGRSSVATYGTTAIDPNRRAAAAGTLRVEQRVDVLVLPAGRGTSTTTLAWYLQHDGPVHIDLVESLRSWQPFIGRRRSSGHGRARVTTVTAFAVDLADDEGLTWWLGGRAAWLAGAGSPPVGTDVTTEDGAAASGKAPWSKTFDWRVREPVAVGNPDGHDGDASTGQGRPRPLRTVEREPIVPGTAWKGVFRHRVEYVLAACGASGADRDAVVAALFGRTGASGQRTTGSRGCLRFHDSGFSTADGKKAPIVTRQHVAIDRVSGGAHDGLLFSVEAVEEGARTRQRIEAQRALPTAVEDLLLHVVRDIHDGLVGIGAGVTRGYGSVRLTDEVAKQMTPGPVDVEAIVAWARTTQGARPSATGTAEPAVGEDREVER